MKDDVVIFLHGIGHSKFYMLYLKRGFEKQGYNTLNIDYPSTQRDIKSLASYLGHMLKQHKIWSQYKRVHFVTHSMGGLVCGFYLQDLCDRQDQLGRVVMLGTPHGGSEIADKLQNFKPYQMIFGPAGQELTTTCRSSEQIEPFYDLGVIAGNKNWFYPLGRVIFNKPHDGCVSVESTQIKGLKDHLTLPVLHGMMCWSRRVRAHCIHFIQNGYF